MPSGHNTLQPQQLDIDQVLADLKNNIQLLEANKVQLVLRWLILYGEYLVKEETFDPLTETIKYDPGTILAVSLGYNTGSEHGGNHFCVVVENNPKSSPVVMVVPLGSSKPSKPVNWNDVDLGVIPEINTLSHYPVDTKSIATVSQMRVVSKLRILAPVKSGDQIVMVDTDKLKDLYDKIRVRFTTKGLNRRSQTGGTLSTP